MSLGPVRASSVKNDASRIDSRDGNMHEEYQPAVPYGTPSQSPEGTKTMLLRHYADLALQQEQLKRHKERTHERKVYLAAGASVAVVLLLTIALVSTHVFSASSLPQAGDHLPHNSARSRRQCHKLVPAGQERCVWLAARLRVCPPG
ncbi:hypothetical protein MTO96_049361 [Rhipicephalus appendiculatus]